MKNFRVASRDDERELHITARVGGKHSYRWGYANQVPLFILPKELQTRLQGISDEDFISILKDPEGSPKSEVAIEILDFFGMLPPNSFTLRFKGEVRSIVGGYANKFMTLAPPSDNPILEFPPFLAALLDHVSIDVLATFLAQDHWKLEKTIGWAVECLHYLGVYFEFSVYGVVGPMGINGLRLLKDLGLCTGFHSLLPSLFVDVPGFGRINTLEFLGLETFLKIVPLWSEAARKDLMAAVPPNLLPEITEHDPALIHLPRCFLPLLAGNKDWLEKFFMCEIVRKNSLGPLLRRAKELGITVSRQYFCPHCDTWKDGNRGECGSTKKPTFFPFNDKDACIKIIEGILDGTILLEDAVAFEPKLFTHCHGSIIVNKVLRRVSDPIDEQAVPLIQKWLRGKKNIDQDVVDRLMLHAPYPKIIKVVRGPQLIHFLKFQPSLPSRTLKNIRAFFMASSGTPEEWASIVRRILPNDVDFPFDILPPSCFNELERSARTFTDRIRIIRREAEEAENFQDILKTVPKDVRPLVKRMIRDGEGVNDLKPTPAFWAALGRCIDQNPQSMKDYLHDLSRFSEWPETYALIGSMCTRIQQSFSSAPTSVAHIEPKRPALAEQDDDRPSKRASSSCEVAPEPPSKRARSSAICLYCEEAEVPIYGQCCISCMSIVH